MNKPSFENFSISKETAQAIQAMGFQEPSPIQTEAIPVILSGRDIIGQAQTGTGKTAAFAIPVIEKIQPGLKQVQAIVLCPTRELAIQVSGEFQKLAKFKRALKVVSLYGGQPIARQVQALKQQPQIIVGTPGRVQDLLNRNLLDLSQASLLVLDEADEMLNMGFRDAIERIFEYLPKERQTILFSATMPQSILTLSQLYLQNPEYVYVEQEILPVPQIQQHYFEVQRKVKTDVLVHLLQTHKYRLSLIFCNTKWQVDALAKRMRLAGFPVEALHGGMTQSKREKAMTSFRQGRTRILIATDIAARGIDVDNVEAVFNYDFPKDQEFYVHRIGRTGRAGQSGNAFTFVENSELLEFKKIQKRLNYDIIQHDLPALA